MGRRVSDGSEADAEAASARTVSGTARLPVGAALQDRNGVCTRAFPHARASGSLAPTAGSDWLCRTFQLNLEFQGGGGIKE